MTKIFAPHSDLPRSALMPFDKVISLLVTTAQTLLDNGEDTENTLATVESLGAALGVKVELHAAWGQLTLQVQHSTTGTSMTERTIQVAPSVPYGINMNRVIATLQVSRAIGAGTTGPAQASKELTDAGSAPESYLWLFVLACAVGGAALSVINGAVNPTAIMLIAFSAGLGGWLRKSLARRFAASTYTQVLVASLLAGTLGALAVHIQISSELRLAALGPLLVLVPGPAILGGAFDLAAYRLPLGFARLGYALLTLLVICIGVLIGLGLSATSLPAVVEGREVSFWLDASCAGVAAAAYGVFYSMPLRLLLYPVIMGTVAHALRWWLVLGLHQGNATGAGLACLLVGIVMVPISRRRHLPFAAVGFASVVSMVPGIFVFRLSGGLAQLQSAQAGEAGSLVAGVFSDGTTALLTVVAMAVGLVLPMHVYSRYGRHRRRQT